MNAHALSIFVLCLASAAGVLLSANYRSAVRPSTRLGGSYLDELSLFKGAAEKKCLVGFSTDSWNLGTSKYKDFLAVHKMYKRIQKANIACIEIPMWECTAGPHYEDLQRLFETFWVPDMTSPEQLLLQFDLTIIPDPVLAKYMVEAFYEKEAKVEKKKAYYKKLIKQPWGVVDAFPPKERYEWERIKQLEQRRSGARKFPPLAACGQDAYQRLKNHGQVEYFSENVQDFALYLPDKLIPSKRVLLLRYKNRFDTLVQSLVMRGVNVTSAYPVTWMRKDWSPQEERMAKEVDVLYLHESHAVLEWRDRLGTKDVVAACHDEGVAKLAKSVGFKEVFYAKKSDTEGLTKTIFSAVEFSKNMQIANSGLSK